MPQTLMLVFVGQGRETHIPVQQVEFTPVGIWSDNRRIATTVIPVGKPSGYSLNPELLTRPSNEDDGFLYESVTVHRLMPSGGELAKALEQFETDPLLRNESQGTCPVCRSVNSHACGFVTQRGVCGVEWIYHSTLEHVYVKCPASEPHVRVSRART